MVKDICSFGERPKMKWLPIPSAQLDERVENVRIQDVYLDQQYWCYRWSVIQLDNGLSPIGFQKNTKKKITNVYSISDNNVFKKKI